MTDPLAQPDAADLARTYADATDVELREAHLLGQAAYRPEAWDVIQEEIRRRGLRWGARTRYLPHIARVRARLGPAKWTLGLRIGLVPAILIVVEQIRRMIEVGWVGGRRGGPLGILAGLFILVWFGVALFIDMPLWLRKRPSPKQD